MTTEEKIKIILQSAAVPKDVRKMLEDINSRQLMYGSFTLKQSEMIDRMFQNVNQKKQPAAGAEGSFALGEIQPKNIAKCWDCGDSGFIRLRRLPEYEEWATYESGSAPCHCDRGLALIAAGKLRKPPIYFGPQFNELWTKSYEIDPAWTEMSGVISRDMDNLKNLKSLAKKTTNSL